MRIIFMGTPEFAVPSLDMLVREGYDVMAVVTQPDKPKGRGNKLTPPPVKVYALEKGIEVLQPVKVRTPEYAEQLRRLKPDLMVTAAYGRILTKEVLQIPPYGTINVHGSLLPKYRGAAPIQWAIINGDQVAGITTMYTGVGMDTGDMLVKREIEITGDMTSGELHDIMAAAGAGVLKETLERLQAGTLVGIPQPHEQATHAPMMEKETGHIDWSRDAQAVHNLVRGTDPWPGAFTFYRGERMRIWKTAVSTQSIKGKIPGTICTVDREGVLVVCGTGAVIVREVQFDSGKRMSVDEYIRGHQINEGEVLG
jgi:methionyl-tRNA formyltransferase